MPLSVGDKLGHYEVLSLIGQGGMGEVYRANDTKLDRQVAIKVMPEALARDPERLERFEREAKVLASLDHPNIGHIYGLLDSTESRGLVLALIEGPTLADQIAIGPLPLDDALSIAKQIIEALEYAHDRGVVHRDLKPANIKITPDGVVKVLDFGLAKVLEDEPPASSLSNSSTLTIGHTRAGVILGTAAYMSPEQAVGRPVDRRSDIFSFGAVLYEMLTGKRAFTGATAPDVLEAVVKNEPDWSALPAVTPTYLRKLLERTLAKDRKQRLQAIGEARIALERGGNESTAPSQSRLGKLWPGLAALLALVLAAGSFLHFRETSPPEQTLRYTISAPENSSVQSFAISPDGRTLVIASVVNGKHQLWLRSMDALQAQPMAFTEDATYPFWSPDSRYIGFFAQGKLKKIAASGGPAQSLCDAPTGRGGSWNRDDVIVFTPTSGTSIQRVAAAGGVPVDVTRTKGILKHPVFLPDGRHFLYVVAIAAVEQVGIYVSSLDGKENRRVLPDASSAMFAPPAHGGRNSHILFVRENTLMAQPFDAASAQLAGDVFPVAEGVSLTTDGNYTRVTASENGVLLYEAGGAQGGNQLGWFDRSGKSLGSVGAPGNVWDPANSPDETSVVFRRATSGGGDLWIRDLSRGTETRFTSDPSVNAAPFWSPQGDRIVFTSNRKGGTYNLYQRAASGSGQDELLLPNTVADAPTQWSRDGRFILYYESDPKTKAALWVLPTQGSAADRKPIPFLRTEFQEREAQLSPDSHWMAFTSDRSGRQEVYVRPFPPSDGEWTISIAGGEQPRWRGDGKELFFEAADGKMMSVSIKAVPVKAAAGTKPSIEAGTPVALFDAHMVPSTNNLLFEYDVTADGKRFLINTTGASGAASPPLTVVMNWQAGLKK